MSAKIKGRLPQSKVNRLRQINAELTKTVHYHTQISANIINWVHGNCTPEQKEIFKDFVEHLCEEIKGD